jgi:cytoskeletal protein CcmA (bactofilin family)
MFGKSKAAKIATVIGDGTEIKGSIMFSGGLHVDGIIKGNVQAEPDSSSALTISEKGTVDGDIHVPNVIINGEVNGDVYGTSRVELAPKAKVTGTVYYNMLEMAMGASVNGQLIHSTEPQRRIGYDGGESAKAKPAAAKPAAAKKPAAAVKQAAAKPAAREDATKTTTIKSGATVADK